jgi:thiamine pyrophosphate-dependent acetolactate synthase large subunit-like protein
MCTPTALGLALSLPHRKIVALDSDGNLLLNLASLGTVANENPRNLVIIVFDNQNYNSGGPARGRPGMATATAGKLSLEHVARGCGIGKAMTVTTAEAFQDAVAKALNDKEGPIFIVAKVDPVDDKAEGPPDKFKQRSFDRRQNKYMFAMHVEQLEKVQILLNKIGG